MSSIESYGPACPGPSHLALHQCILQQASPVLQQGANPVPAPIHAGQALLQLLAVLGELGTTQVDGQDDGFAVVYSFLKLLKEKEQ